MKQFNNHQTWFFYLLLLTIVAFSSCVNEIDFTAKQSATVLTVNCIAQSDSILKVNLSYSNFFLSSSKGYSVAKNYVVKLYVNDNYQEILKYKNSQYISIYKPKATDKLKLESTITGVSTTTTGTTELPLKTAVLSIDTTMEISSSGYLTHDTIDSNGHAFIDTIGFQNNYKMGIVVNFNDDSNVNNFYRITAYLYQYYKDGSFTSKKINLSPDDLAFDRTDDAKFFDNNPNKIYNIFNDNLFNGRQYGLTTKCSLNQLNITPEKIKYFPLGSIKTPIRSQIIFNLQSISEDFFLYLKSVKYNNTDLQYFSEPVQIYSNISGGLGLFGSSTYSFYPISLPVTSKSFFIN